MTISASHRSGRFEESFWLCPQPEMRNTEEKRFTLRGRKIYPIEFDPAEIHFSQLDIAAGRPKTVRLKIAQQYHAHPFKLTTSHDALNATVQPQSGLSHSPQLVDIYVKLPGILVEGGATVRATIVDAIEPPTVALNASLTVLAEADMDRVSRSRAVIFHRTWSSNDYVGSLVLDIPPTPSILSRCLGCDAAVAHEIVPLSNRMTRLDFIITGPNVALAASGRTLVLTINQLEHTFPILFVQQ